ncbi:hypothetical protein Hdeb2414_s0001g00036951 [Helianthus debilis subsp. tardiflorus]
MFTCVVSSAGGCFQGHLNLVIMFLGTAPNRIPYHLYLLVKEAVMKRHDNTIDLATVERKIHFFCNYFHSHLPYHGWKYRDAASTVVTRYRFKRGPKYNMADYIPFSLKDLKVAEYEFDKYTNLSRQEMIKVMSIIHSRKTPTFWKLSLAMISFYCKICSCFGIDYRRLEGASEDDVCLMKSISMEEEEEDAEEERSKASSSTPNKAEDVSILAISLFVPFKLRTYSNCNLFYFSII